MHISQTPFGLRGSLVDCCGFASISSCCHCSCELAAASGKVSYGSAADPLSFVGIVLFILRLVNIISNIIAFY
jgi:hypothetical protein